MNVAYLPETSRVFFALLLAALVTLFVGSRSGRAANIGPDPFGYIATNAVPFSYTDISRTGTRVLGGSDDGTYNNASLGFLFKFYGTDYAAASFSPNGLITFGGSTTAFVNSNLSAVNPPANLPSIAVLWDDWQFFQTGADAVYFQTLGAPGSQQFVVQWNLAHGYESSPSAVTFQAALFEGSNNILFRYLDVDAGNSRSFGGSATVGIANKNSSITGERLQWSYNSPVVANGEAVLIRSVPEPASLAIVGIGAACMLVASLRRERQGQDATTLS